MSESVHIDTVLKNMIKELKTVQHECIDTENQDINDPAFLAKIQILFLSMWGSNVAQMTQALVNLLTKSPSQKKIEIIQEKMCAYLERELKQLEAGDKWKEEEE
jgi:hypothetical protein